MNYTMIINQPMHSQPPLPPLGEPESKKIGFIAPIFITSNLEISKTVNMLFKDDTTNVITR